MNRRNSSDDPVESVLVDSLYRGGHVPHVRDWLDSLALTEARRRWHAGACYITTDGHRWKPATRSTGRLAVVCPALAPECSPFLDDLVAFDPEKPGRWYLLTGEGVFLGRDLVLPFGLPVNVYRNPLDWARAAGEGVVILNSGRAWPYLTGNSGLKLAARDRAHGLAIRQALRPPVVMPEIVVQVAA